jgi:outer membrane protein assembly factor BamB
MSDTSRQRVYIGIKGRVLALDRVTGEEVWRTKLQSASVMTLGLIDGQLFAGVNGELYCLDAADGKVLWRNRLRGLGTGFLAIANAGQQGEAVATIADQQTRQNAANSAMFYGGAVAGSEVPPPIG